MFFDPHKWLRRLHYWRHRHRLERELREEIEEHRRQRGRASISRPARHMEDARAVWISPALESALQDIRYGVRQLRQNPSFTCIAISGLALAIGLSTSFFSILETIYWRPLPVKDAERVVRMLRVNRDSPRTATFSELEITQYRTSPALEQSTAYAVNDRLIAQWPQSTAPRATAAFVAPDFFPLLGGEILLGRALLPGEPDTTALLSESAWRRRLSASADIIGSKLVVGDVAFTVAGVVADKSLAILATPVDLILPLSAAPQLQFSQARDRLQWLAKLPPNRSANQAEGALQVVVQQWFTAHPEDRNLYRLLVLPARLATGLWTDFRGAILFLTLTVVLVLFIACANLTNLLLARAEARQQEMAVRLALGASRLRLIRQLLTECFLLTVSAGVLGMFCTNAILRLLQAYLLRAVPTEFSVPWLEFSVNGPIFLFLFTLCAVTAFFFGLAPARAATRVDYAGAMKSGSAEGRLAGAHLRKLLIIGQMAACIILLVAAASLNQTMSRFRDSMSVLDAKPVLQVELRLASYGYSNAAAQDLMDQARRRLSLLPEIEATGFTPTRLIYGSSSAGPAGMQREGSDAILPPPGLSGTVSNGVLSVFGLQLRQGRDFTHAESRQGAPVVLINEAVARDLWPRSNPIGQRIRFWSKGQPGAWREIIGVIAEEPGGPVGPIAYSVLEPLGASVGNGYLQIRTRAGQKTVPAAVRQLVADLDPRIAATVSSAQAMIDLGEMGPRLVTIGSVLVGLSSLFMAAIGLYGVTSYLATRRTKEIGIRMALGARPANVVALIVRQGTILAVAGVALGILVARTGEYYLSAAVPTWPSSHLRIYGAVAAFLLTVAVGALAVPSLRAARIDPVAALRNDG